MPQHSSYDKYPVVPVRSSSEDCLVGWKAIVDHLHKQTRPGRYVVCVECYPGSFEDEIERVLRSQQVGRVGCHADIRDQAGIHAH